jgi:hypothetical protein
MGRLFGRLTAPYAANTFAGVAGVSHHMALAMIKIMTTPISPNHAVNGCSERRKFFAR